MKYAINGRFVVRKLTGQERFATELLRELDKICKKGEFVLVVPEYAETLPDYKNIKIVKYGKVKATSGNRLVFIAIVKTSFGECELNFYLPFVR